jgi:hypothetical protein
MHLDTSSINGGIEEIMKNTAVVILLFAAAICAPAATKKKEQTAPPAPQALTIPKDAVPSPDGNTFSYTDKEGKKWTYAKTPFGVVRSLSDGKPGARPAELYPTKAIDKGDTVRFEHASPFGTMSWEKKKSDLSDDERRILDGQNAKTQ